jgi:alpha 1,3-glucosidase
MSSFSRPLFLEYPDDPTTFKAEDRFLVGSSILVQPVIQSGVKSVSVSLPGKDEIWYHYHDLTVATNASPATLNLEVTLEKTPVFLRGGHIISRYERVRRSSSLMLGDPIHLIVALDKNVRSAL